jgi:hypothetical protein
MEIYATFYDNCLHETTLPVYPSSSLTRWLTNTEDPDLVGAAFQNIEEGSVYYTCIVEQL